MQFKGVREMAQCPKCKSENRDESAYCRQCGNAMGVASDHRTSVPAQSGSRTQELSRRQLLGVGLIFLLIAWVSTAGIAYGVTELTGGGPRGAQGAAGPAGPRGSEGPAGQSAADFGSNIAFQRLAGMMAVQFIVNDNPGETIIGSDPRVRACRDYIVDGTGSFVECGFKRAGP